jgi:hypothetical protein
MNILEIKDKLLNDEIDYGQAFEEIKKLPKAWHTKEWSLKREQIIKDTCEQCGISGGVMVAQHLAHPEDFATIRNRLFNSLHDAVLETTSLPQRVVTKTDILEFRNQTTNSREACPQCKWVNIRKRKKIKPKYFCEFCKIGFEEAATIEYNDVFKTIPTDEQVSDYLLGKMEHEIRWNFKRDLYAKHEKQIGKEALLISINLHLEYMKLDNVVTFCKRCAAKMDLENKLICWSCKTDYFEYLLYDNCYKCYCKNSIVKNPIKQRIWHFRGWD